MKKTLYAAYAALLLVVPSVVSAADIKLTTENYPPFNMEQNGEIVGLSTDLVRAIFEQAGVSYEIKVLPWKRAYQNALINKNTCVFSTTYTEERLPLFEWVGPLVSNDWVLFARAGHNYNFSSLEDAKELIIGGYNGDAVAVFLENNGYTVSLVRDDKLNPAKLANGRIDLWATGEQLGLFLAREQGINTLEKVLSFKETKMGVACHKETDPEILAKLRAALKVVKKEAQ